MVFCQLSDPRVSSSSCTKAQMSWANVLSQTPRRIAASPSSVLASSHSGNEGKVGVPEDKVTRLVSNHQYCIKFHDQFKMLFPVIFYILVRKIQCRSLTAQYSHKVT